MVRHPASVEAHLCLSYGPGLIMGPPLGPGPRIMGPGPPGPPLIGPKPRPCMFCWAALASFMLELNTSMYLRQVIRSVPGAMSRSGKIFSNSLPPLPDPPEPSVTGLNPLEDREPETRGGEEQSDRWSLDKSPIPTHLCPMFSLFLVSAFFPSPTFVNWTYASPEGLPLKSVRCEIRET